MANLIKLHPIEVFNQSSIKLRTDPKEQSVAPAMLGVKLGLLLREIAPILEEFEKSKESLIKKLGETKVDGDREYFQVKVENMPEFTTEIENLYKMEFEITNTIDIKYLEGVNFPMWYSDSLVDFIQE